MRSPAGPGWQHAATTAPDMLATTWHAGDNIGVGCWKSGMLGVDPDVRDEVSHGPNELSLLT
ncbi:bifunctional DNA primase/polymerase [[Actinomadura] parvosata]|uniref:bifunctional DNA primase/polymerase n=1 Tax=[Actinomadura] parvosata TaxID=1955412 RepID=UPI00406D4E00